MQRDGGPDTALVDRIQNRRLASCFSIQTMIRGYIIIACLTGACTDINKRPYLTASEIQEVIIGNGVREAGSRLWREDYLRNGTDAADGWIRGRTKSAPPYTGTWSIVGDSLCVEYPGSPDSNGCFHLSLEKGTKLLWFEEDGELSYESELTNTQEGQTVFARPPHSLSRKETLTFQHDENSLSGDLSFPDGPPPYPAIVFVAGAGAHPRPWSFNQAMSDEFIRRGFATFMWSKPGVDESTGDWRGQSMDQRAGEVEAAMSRLASRVDIEGDQIGLFGDSQAGWVVPKLATRRKVAFMILQSCPADDAMSQTLYAVESIVNLLAATEGERAEILDLQRSYLALIRASQTHEEFLRGQELLLANAKQHPWYAKLDRSPTAPEASFLAPQGGPLPPFLRFLPVEPEYFHFLHRMFVNAVPPRLEDLQSPLLAIYGTKDIAVDWRLGSSAYERVPKLAGNRDVTVVLFEDADHTLMRPDREGYLDYPPDYLTTMGKWLAAHR